MIRPLLSKGQKIRFCLSLAGLVALFSLYYIYLLKPAMESAANTEIPAAETTAVPDAALEQNSISAELKEKISQLKRQKKSLDSYFIREKNIPPLTRTLRNLAQKYNVNLRDSVKVSGSEQQGHFVKAGCTLTAVGKAEDIRQFLTALAEEGCLIKSADMAVAVEKKDGAVMKLSVSFTYYRYNK
jgi:Tfp pilus assembly protein PilO